MSGTRSAIDTMTAEDTALLDSMRDDGPGPAPEAIEAPTPAAPDPEIDLDDASEASAETDDAPRPSKMVPHGQFHAANERRKAAEAKAAALEAKLQTTEAVVAERLRILTEAAQAAMAPPPGPTAAEIEIPDVNTDPVGHFQAMVQKQARQLEEMQAIVSGVTEGQRAQQALAEMKAWGTAQEVEFGKANPDYGTAMDYLMQKRAEQLTEMGVKDPVEIRKALAADVNQVAQRSRADGTNFAERLYRLAHTLGYQKPAPAIPPIDAALDAPVADRAARIEEGRQNSTTIGGAGGAASPTRLTPERIAAMPDRQFQAYVDGLRAKNPAAFRELMGA